MRTAVSRLIKAIEDEGVCPSHHRATMVRHRREWPALWKAIDDLKRAKKAEDERARMAQEITFSIKTGVINHGETGGHALPESLFE